MKPIRNILFLQASDGMFSYRRQAGAQHIAVANGWLLHTVRYTARKDGSYRLHRPRGAKSVADLIAMWHLHGVIVECGLEDERIPPDAFGKTPVVYLDHGARPPSDGCGHVVCDQASFAQQAARELLASGFGDYAFVPAAADAQWSRIRGEAFKAAIRAAGKRFWKFAAAAANKGESRASRISRSSRESRISSPDIVDVPMLPAEAVEAWLEPLPKPVGVFAANDWSGKAVLGACARLGLRVPEEVAVVGVDNSWHVCATCSPTLTSIPQNFEGEGATAAGFLGEMMKAPGRTFPPRQCAAAHIVRRESTHFASWRDERVARGLEFIRQGACGGISPADVARAMCASRTLADAAFRKALGHTILDEIHAVRIRTAQDMLARGVQPDIVAQNCGYASTNDFRRVFKRRTGKNIRQWRKDGAPV